jgi:erythromycin esterase-like protein
VSVPGVTSVEGLIQVAADFVVGDLDLAAEPAAAAAARQSLDDSRLLLLGEMHGARENPLLARALMQAVGITRLALEWDEDLARVFEAFLATGTLGAVVSAAA